VIPREVVHQSLRADLPYFAIASVVFFIGIASLILWRLRSREPLLLWLGALSTLYGLRLFIANDLVRAAAELDPKVQRQVVDCITYFIGIPAVFFFRTWLVSHWRKFLTGLLYAQLAFTPLAIVVGSILGYRGPAMAVNGLIVLTGAFTALLAVVWKFRTEPGAVLLRWTFGLFLVLVVLTNLQLTGGRDIEPIGFLALLIGLTYTAATRAADQEQKLIAVEKELETARRIQTSILPKSLPELNGLRIAARYQPMTAVAGDFYDFLLVDDQRVTLLVADVSGHGVPAALIASMLKVGFAAQKEHARDPAAVLAGLNLSLSGMMGSQFVTAACAFIDLEAQTVTYAGAGHPPSLLIRKDSSEVVELAENGLFLGPFKHATYTNVSTSFTPGDYLLVYTDGIIEATMPDNQPFGSDRLKDFAVVRRSAAPSELVDDLIRKVAGKVQEDDLTVVTAHAS